MKAIAYRQHGLPIADPGSLVEIDLPRPVPGPRDLLVAVRAVSVNPVDTKVRRNMPTEKPRVIGWDAAGEVCEVGEAVELFRPGDQVFYSGTLNRPGSSSEYQLVDERCVGLKPKSLSDAEAAALPLTSVTAWELLFDRLGMVEGECAGETLLIVGAAGGVGSMLIQLARQLTKLTVIGTASRAETRAWVEQLGAHHVIDHSLPLHAELQRIGIDAVDYVASLTHTDRHFPELVKALRPQGKLGLIDDPKGIDIVALKQKSLSLHWEYMFTRTMFGTEDQIRQHEILTRVARMIDDGILRTTLAEHFGAINAGNLRRAHALIESGQARGKIVLEGF